MQLLLEIPALFFSIIIHEVAHGFIAYRKGDDTAYLSGRLTLNPVSHIDLVGTIILPAISLFSGVPLIGWAKPVPVNPYRMKDPYRSMVYVALAGPAANIFLSIVSVGIVNIFVLLGAAHISFLSPVVYIFQYMIYINLILGFFNLFPVYPLDGGQILLNILPYNYREKYEKIIPYGIYIVLFFVMTGLIKYWIIFPTSIVIKLYGLLGLVA
ncbi:MAG: site-2 protease family protein [Elusimicrobia bacterium]|jgi:Zn-dependent protease|nr:site-2 protease family protein [Elusimicrobiota bacterium]